MASSEPRQAAGDTERMNRLLSIVMDMGEIMLTSGAEVNRVEDTMTRLCLAFGFIRVDVFTITSSIVVTAETSVGSPLTQTRRIRVRGTDLGKVGQINALSRMICAGKIDIPELKREVEKIRAAKGTPISVQLAMYVAIAFSLSIFFGGSWEDGAASSISGAVLFAALCGCSALKLNDILSTMLCSAASALAVLILVRAGIGEHADKIMIGDIMLVIPGRQFTNSLRDMIGGDTISGLLNMSEAVLRAVFVALGFALVLFMTR